MQTIELTETFSKEQTQEPEHQYIVFCEKRGALLGIHQSGPVWSGHANGGLLSGGALCFPTLDKAAELLMVFDMVRGYESTMRFPLVKPDLEVQSKRFASVYACMDAGQRPWLTPWPITTEFACHSRSGPLLRAH